MGRGARAGLGLRAARRRASRCSTSPATPICCDEVAAALDAHAPDVVVVNAGGARFTDGDPITMTADDVVAVARHAPGAPVVAVHLEAINHCLETRADLHQRLHAEGLEGRVTVPEDGAGGHPSPRTAP